MTTNPNIYPGTEDRLEDALAMLAAGLPLETVLAEAGDDAAWLEPLLATAVEVGELQAAIPIPPPDASLQKMLAHGKKLAGPARPASPTRPARQNILFNLFSGGFRLASGLATALLVLFLVGGTLSLAAQRSLPGDSLYWLKQTSESVRLNLTRNPIQREQLQETFRQRRLQEVELLLEQGRDAEVTIEGRLLAAGPTAVELEGFTVEITPDTQINGQPAAGANVTVRAKVQDTGRLTALVITVVEPAPASPTPAPSPTPEPLPTATPQPTATPLPPTVEPEPGEPAGQTVDTLELTPTPTHTPEPTATPSPEPAQPALAPEPAAPPPDDTGANNDDFNQNQNDDDGNENFDDNDDNLDDNGVDDDDFDGDNLNDDGDDDSGGNSGPGGGDNSGPGNSNDDNDNDNDDDDDNDNSDDDDDDDDDHSGKGRGGDDNS